jgi:hypothetical protein
MLRRGCMGILLLLLCACGPHFFSKKTLPLATGMHISKLTKVWGEPEVRKENPHSTGRLYSWRKNVTEQKGGYYYTSSTKEAIYDKNYKIIGYYDAPKQDYVDSYGISHSCQADVITNEQGIIVYTLYFGDNYSCWYLFPLP